MHERRYARYGGWRRCDCCWNSRFGFEGPNHAGFGRYGMFGGYRSHYNYSPECLCKLYRHHKVNTSPTVIAELPFLEEIITKKITCLIAMIVSFLIVFYIRR